MIFRRPQKNVLITENLLEQKVRYNANAPCILMQRKELETLKRLHVTAAIIFSPQYEKSFGVLCTLANDAK